MSTGIELPAIDLEALEAKLAAEQRSLLKLAMRKPSGRTRPDEAAASKLLLYFSKGMIRDADAQEAIMDGMRDVAAYVVNETLLRQDGQPVTVHPLMYFHGADYPSPTKKNNKSERVAIAAGFNYPSYAVSTATSPLMSEEEFEYALTRMWTDKDVQDAKDRKFGKKEYRKKWPKMRARKDWPSSPEAVERILMKYVHVKHGFFDKSTCRNYVSACMEASGWLQLTEGRFAYPDSWGR